LHEATHAAWTAAAMAAQSLVFLQVTAEAVMNPACSE